MMLFTVTVSLLSVAYLIVCVLMAKKLWGFIKEAPEIHAGIVRKFRYILKIDPARVYLFVGFLIVTLPFLALAIGSGNPDDRETIVQYLLLEAAS